MKDEHAGLEVERYELFEQPSYRFDLARREFFKTLGGGVVVLLLASELHGRQESGRRGFGRRLPEQLNAWLHIGHDGRVTIFTGKVEIGQNARTSLTQVVCEELTVRVSSVGVIMGDTARTPFDRGTFGSRTTPTMIPQLRRAAATARNILLQRAAARWKVKPESLSLKKGRITNPGSDGELTLGELAAEANLTATIGPNVPTVAPTAWKVEGRSVPKVDGRSLVTGKHHFPSDQKRPGMLHGKVLRPPTFNAALKSVLTEKAEALPGVTVVCDGNFIGVAAPTSQAAERACALLQAEWKSSPPQVSDKTVYEYLKTHVSHAETRRFRGSYSSGSVQDGMEGADIRLEESYRVAYIAHAPLEPRAAVAEWRNGMLTVWTGTQRPFGVQSELANAFHLQPDQVRVLMPDMGSGYGGKHTGEAAIEAARLARATGKPVKITWSRQEEFTWAYFRPAGLIEVRSGVTRDGSLTAWEFHNYNSGGSAIETPYEVPAQKIQFHRTDSPLRQGSYRGLAATANNFAREVHMDELAAQLKIDPLAFRLKNLKDERLRTVLKTAAERFGWGHRKPAPGHGFGLACGFEKGGYVATCAEVSVDRPSGNVRVRRVVEAFECGAVINPGQLENQISGAIVQGLGGALFEAIEFENGEISNPLFSGYRLPRFSDVPEIEVVLVDRKDLPSAGAGETPLIGIAPAVSNAIFRAVGVRLRSLPMVPDRLKL